MYFPHLCLLSGFGRGSEAQLDPDEPGFESQQHWPCRGAGLVFGEDGEDPEKSVMRGGGKALWIQTELVEGEMVKWVRGRLHDWCWDVPSPSCRSEWIWACSCHFIGDHMICGYERKYEKNAVEGVEISFMWISMNLRWFHHVFCRSLSAVRHWQRDWSTTRPWQTWLCFATTLVLPGLRLGVWWGCWGLSRIGHEGGEERHYGSRQS